VRCGTTPSGHRFSELVEPAKDSSTRFHALLITSVKPIRQLKDSAAEILATPSEQREILTQRFAQREGGKGSAEALHRNFT